MIKRYEPITVKNVVNDVNELGEYTTTLTDWFQTRGLVHDLSNTLRISERYRVYSDLMNITLNLTPNTRAIVDVQEDYSFFFRGKDWRITDCRESNDRQYVTFICYRNDPTTPV
jgi:hypothetical protein